MPGIGTRIPRHPCVRNPNVRTLDQWVPRPPKPKITQNWKAYNEAQTHEIPLFDEFLKELVSTIEEPERTPGPGRPPLPISDQLFASIQKVYCQFSSRRASGLYGVAEERGQLTRAPHFNTSSIVLNRKEITPILQDLVQKSSLPFTGIETEFAIDSTGFRTSTFGRYFEDKHKVKQNRHYLKAHIMSGINTNVVTAVIVTDEYGADSPQLSKLVPLTAENFTITEVSGDKAYSSRENHKIIGQYGGDPYLLFKKNATGRSKGSPLWKKAFIFFCYNEDAYLEHYHKRSNVESTIGAIKRKLGESLMSKNHVAQVNEVLCKIIAYNITVLIHQIYESGIVADFEKVTPISVLSEQ